MKPIAEEWHEGIRRLAKGHLQRGEEIQPVFFTRRHGEAEKIINTVGGLSKHMDLARKSVADPAVDVWAYIDSAHMSVRKIEPGMSLVSPSQDPNHQLVGIFYLHPRGGKTRAWTIPYALRDGRPVQIGSWKEMATPLGTVLDELEAKPGNPAAKRAG
jgi:hypothetical protein